jgi:hypothetical protein
MYYKPKYFKPWELVDKTTYELFGDDVWFLFRPEMLMSLDNIREHFGKPVTVNNWKEGGKIDSGGFRTNTDPTGAKYSQHRFGNAADCHFQDLNADEVRAEIIKNKDAESFKFITCLEVGVTWVHFDCRNIENRIKLIKP